jgi:hypothetical protein
MGPSAEPASERSTPAQLVPAGLLQDGEVVILAIKPSSWFVLVSSLPMLASAAVVAAVAYVVDLYHPATHERIIWSGCAAVALLRMVAACWQWLGRTYVLSNLRIISVRGLLRPQWSDAALSKVAQVVPAASLPERLVGAASIYCMVASDDPPAVTWHTVARPAEVHEVIVDAVSRAKRPP